MPPQQVPQQMPQQVPQQVPQQQVPVQHHQVPMGHHHGGQQQMFNPANIAHEKQ